EVPRAQLHALQPLRTTACRLPQVRPLQNLSAGARAPGRDPRHDEIELVTVLTDPVADMLARIRNANKALHESTQMPTSRLEEGIARILKEEGYISDYHVKKGDSFDTLVVKLKYGRSRERIITDLKRVSKPGRRVYAGKDRLPRVLGGMGVAIMSTSNGLVTSRTAEEKGIGGEVVGFVW